MPHAITRKLGLLFFVVLPACQWVGGYENFSGEEADANLHRCSGLSNTKLDSRGEAMARVDVPGSGCLWIDRDEVTVQEYNAWLADASPVRDGWDPDYCAWKDLPSNPSGDPEDTCGAQVRSEEVQPFANEKPIRCVDWCDAEAFCRWSGKHLCYDFVMGTQVPRSEQREWYYACSNAQTAFYPWGNEAGEGDCNVGQHADALIPAERGPFPVHLSVKCASERGVRNLVGNVAEWVYGCNIKSVADLGKVTPCLTRGGAYYEPMRSCIQDSTRSNDTRDPGVGFRCCADLSEDESLEVSARAATP